MTSSDIHPNETLEEVCARRVRNTRIRVKMCAANAGDHAEARRHWATQVFSVGILLAIKAASGAAWIRALNLDAWMAVAVFGPGWLDETDE